jgi:predicted nucleotidyltransferase
MVGVREAMELLQSAVSSDALAGLCREHRVDLLVLFGSAVHSPDPGDIDLAVAFTPGEPHDFLLFLNALAVLVPGDHLDVMDLAAAGPVAMRRALIECRVLYATTPAAFFERQIFAINHYIETQPLRDALLESLT